MSRRKARQDQSHDAHASVCGGVHACEVVLSPPLMPVSLGGDVTDGNVMVLFSTHTISLDIMAALFYDVIALI